MKTRKRLLAGVVLLGVAGLLTFAVLGWTRADGSPFTQADLDQSYQRGKAAGEEVGRKAGYQSGQSAGRSTGYNTGYDAGYDEGYTVGYDQAVQEAVDFITESIIPLIGTTSYSSVGFPSTWSCSTYAPSYSNYLDTTCRGY